jgi:hypothetical protein
LAIARLKWAINYKGEQLPHYKIGRGTSRFVDISFHISVILATGNCQNPTGWNAGQILTNKKNYAFFVRMFVFYRSLTFFSLKIGRNCPKKLLSL